jgi:hypothetical protein
MFVRFRQTPYGLQVSLIQTRREGGKVRHEHIAGLGAIIIPASMPSGSISGGACMTVYPRSRIGSETSRAKSSGPSMSESRCRPPKSSAT